MKEIKQYRYCVLINGKEITRELNAENRDHAVHLIKRFERCEEKDIVYVTLFNVWQSLVPYNY